MIAPAILFLFLVFLPAQLGRHFWPEQSFLFGLKIDYLSPTFYLQDIFILLLIILSWKKIIIFLRSHQIIFFLFSLFLILNLVFSLSPLVAFFAWLRITELIILGVALSSRSKAVLALMIKIAPFWIIFEFLLGTVQVVRGSSLGSLFWLTGERTFNFFTPGIARASFLGQLFLRPYGTFSHPNSLAGFILVATILTLTEKKPSFWTKTATIAGLTLILLSFSRTVWLATFFLGLGFLFWKLKKLGRLSFSYLLTIISLPLFTYFFTQTRLDPSSFQQREALAHFALGLVRESPLMGIGAGNFVIALAKEGSWQWLYWLQPVHNIFFLTASELGLLGLLGFLGMLAIVVKKRPDWPIFLSLLIILFTGFFDHYWLTLIQNQLLLVVILALSFGLQRDKIG